MEPQSESTDRSISASLKATYRALLARGLEAGEAANLTAFLHGLPSTGFRWSLPEIEAIVQRRIDHAAALRAEAVAAAELTTPPARTRRHAGQLQRATGAGSTHVIDPPRT
jgi:hypothetical protein